MFRLPLVLALAFGYLVRLGCDAATTYQPAAGFFVCPLEKSCVLTECEKCSIFVNGAELEDEAVENGSYTFTSTSLSTDNLSVSGSGGVAKCDDGCKCQGIGGVDVDSCVNSFSLSIPEGGADSGEAGAGEGEGTGDLGDRNINQAVESESSSMRLVVGRVSALISAILLFAMA